MVVQEEATFEGFSCIKLSNDLISLWITKDFGPRILGLCLNDLDNLMAVLPDAVIPVNGAEDYSLRGGHRLWYGPENPHISYIPDDQPVDIAAIKNGLEINQKTDVPTGIQKSIRVVLDEKLALIKLDHKLINKGINDFFLSPWAITMLKPGGIGFIPMQAEHDDPFGVLPNRQLVFWPYTRINSPYLEIKDQAVGVKATLSDGALKIGLPNPDNWLAYGINNVLFVKRAEYQKNANYIDRGASSQIYCNPDLIELETLGPALNLGPGESILHQEVWQIYNQGTWPAEILEIYQSFK